MKKTKAVIFMLVLIWSMSLCKANAAPATPRESIKSTVDAILAVLRDKEMSKPDQKEARRNGIRNLINDRFDFEEMAKRSLARHWRQRTPEEAGEFTSVFSDLLVASYIGKIEGYTDEKVTYDNEVIKKDRYGVVNTTIITRDVNIPIDYKVILKGEKWWIYDVVVEGVSFISTYRGQYDKIIMRESYASLIRQMKTKLDEVNAM